ncbi:MAG: DUF6785 family protein [Candidatus Bathyarchaeia archaeon]|nr:hypothetical protein [Candidatus Bathyarchaeota archaeon]
MSEYMGIRTRTWIIGIIAVILSTIFTTFVALFTTGGTLWGLTINPWAQAQSGTLTFVFWWPLIIASLAAVLARNGGLNKQEVTIVLAMVWVSWMIPSFYGVLPVLTMMGTARQIPAFHRWNLEYLKPAHWQWGPDPFNDKLWESWMYGGPVPWAEWMPALSWHIVRILAYYLCYMFLASMFRRQWVDLEALPFPHATAAAKLIDMAYEKVDGGTRLFQNVWLWLGLLIGFLAIYPYWAWTLPGLGVAQLMYPATQGIDLTPYVILPQAPLTFNFEAFFIGFFFLIPVKTLFSFIVVDAIAFRVIPPIICYLGLWEPHSAGSSGGINAYIGWTQEGWTGPLMQSWQQTWGKLGWITVGAMFGLMFFPIFVTYRSELINAFKAIIGKAPPEVEAREPLKFRYMLLGFIVFLLVYIATWWSSSLGYLPVLWGIFWTVVNGLYWVGRARIAGDAGLIFEDLWNEQRFAHYWNSTMVGWFLADTSSPFFMDDLQKRYLVVRADYPWYTSVIKAAPMASIIESYKIGSLEGVHSKYIFIAGLIATILGVVLSMFVILQMWYSFGALNLSTFNYTGAPHNHYQRGPTYRVVAVVGDYWRQGITVKPTANQWILFSVGFIIVSLIHALSARYPWFPVNAPGTALGLGIFQAALWFPAIIAYIAKVIVMRIGGAKLYEDVAMPFAIGMAASVSLAILLGVASGFATTLTMM